MQKLSQRMIKPKEFLLLMLTCWVVVNQVYAAQQVTTYEIKDTLQGISKKDYQALDQLFKTLMFDQCFAYTLFGSKPMSHHGTFHYKYYKAITNPKGKHLFLEYWSVWKKYSNLLE